MTILQNGIEIYGVADEIILNSQYFKEFEVETTRVVDEYDDEINNILSINAQVIVDGIDIITTPIMLSNDGSYLSGYKLKVELVINVRIKYLLKRTIKQFGVSNEKIIKTAYIVLPIENKGVNMIDLLRRRKIIATAYIEDIYVYIRESNELCTNLSLIVVSEFLND